MPGRDRKAITSDINGKQAGFFFWAREKHKRITCAAVDWGNEGEGIGTVAQAVGAKTQPSAAFKVCVNLTSNSDRTLSKQPGTASATGSTARGEGKGKRGGKEATDTTLTITCAGLTGDGNRHEAVADGSAAVSSSTSGVSGGSMLLCDSTKFIGYTWAAMGDDTGRGRVDLAESGKRALPDDNSCIEPGYRAGDMVRAPKKPAIEAPGDVCKSGVAGKEQQSPGKDDTEPASERSEILHCETADGGSGAGTVPAADSGERSSPRPVNPNDAVSYRTEDNHGSRMAGENDGW